MALPILQQVRVQLLQHFPPQAYPQNSLTSPDENTSNQTNHAFIETSAGSSIYDVRKIPRKQTDTLIIICYKTNIGAKLQNE